MWQILNTVLRLGASLVPLFKGSKNGPTKLTDALPYVLQHLLPAVESAIRVQGLDTKAKFDSWLEALDETTGDDPGAVHILKDLTPEMEEAFFDHLIEAARIYGYALLKVDGYHQA